MSSENYWQCPNCKRYFENENQWHSCVTAPLENHFKDKPPELKQIFDYLVQKLNEFGPVKIDPVQTSINLGAKAHFAVVYPLQNSLNLEFVSNKPIETNRIFKKQTYQPQTYINHVKLIKKEDVDSDLLSWLRQAYFMKS